MSKASNGSGSIFPAKRKDGTVVYKVQVKTGTRPDGTPIRTTRTAATMKEAKELRVRLVNARLDGRLTTISAETVRTYGLAWVRNVAAQRVRESTASDYEARLRRDICPWLGDVRLVELTPVHVDRWIGSLRASGKSASTVNGARRVLNMICKHAWRTGVIPSNPVMATDPVKSRASDPTRVRPPWRMEEVSEVLDAATSSRDMDAFLHVLLHTGMRPGEALALRWEDVDLQARRLRVTGTLKEERRFLPDGQTVVRLVRNEPKTASSRRPLPISDALFEALERHLMHRSVLQMTEGPGWQDSGYVFTTSRGTPISMSNHRRKFKKFLQEIGVRYIRLHDIRHTVALLALNDGNVPIEKASQALGHTRIDTTKQIYAGHVPQYNEDFIAGISSVLPSARGLQPPQADQDHVHGSHG